MCLYIYTLYIYIERERERDLDTYISHIDIHNTHNTYSTYIPIVLKLMIEMLFLENILKPYNLLITISGLLEGLF